MAMIKCVECGKEFSDRASACPECGCPTEYSVDSNNVASDSDGFVEQDSIVEDETEESTTNISDTVKDFAGKALASWNDRNHATSKVNVIKVDEQHRTFQIKGYIPKHKSGGVGKALKGALAVSTFGMSSIISSSVNSAGANNWYNFDDLVSYELLADDSVVVSGGVGQALIGGLAFGGAGAVAGGITGKRKQKKKIESLIIRVTLNDFKTPCICIPIVTKAVKVGTKDYFQATTEAQQVLSMLDVIAHNK
ncbi:hypothetical protein [uncultured Eubacterium sp.]|jgi:hypothetical protein|uniref:hypothetical protein n=1 Tax=uncultured Eubacterium sp. TaxID=165185 RepID=UPI002046EB05|nr:hypothetical protein [uncultured Eubacterium sp.]DAX02897.1 MAG TPA: DNA-directed RNA polymerase [Bacteriophage sp.]